MRAESNVVMSRIYIFLMVVILVIFLYLLAPILEPFYIAALLAYLTNPLVDRLQRLRIPRILAVVIVFFLMLACLTLLGLFLIPRIIDQINLLIHQLPVFFDWLQNTAVPWLNLKLGEVMQFNMQNVHLAVIEGLKNHQDVIGKIITTITSSSLTVISILFQMLLIPVVTFYLLRDWHQLITNCRKILPRHLEPTVVLLVRRYNSVLKAFIKGQLLVMIILSVIYTIGLWLIGLQFALLIGILVGLLSIVPYLGFTIGLITALFAAYYQFHSINSLLYVLLVFIIGQCIESMLLTPLLVGDSIGLHPVAVIFSVLTGGYFFGIIGALIALPVAAAIMVLMRYGLTMYYRSSLYSL